MFQGSSNLSLDVKGRMTVPSRHRDALQLQSEGRLTVTKHPHGCLLMFPRPIWEQHREKIAAWPMQAKAWQRIFLGSAVDVDMDASGRLLITPELRDAAHLAKEVTLLGMGSHFEVWDAATLAKQEAEAIAQGMPASLENFSF
jgi:MraZ protein